MDQTEINWDRLDKKKFFTMGVGLFSAVTTALYPLSVIKTRQMANNRVSGGLSGTKQTAVNIWHKEGVRGFYRGFGTVVFGTIPSRSIYLSTLEVTKAAVDRVGSQAGLSPTTLAATSSFLAGASASMSTQVVIVPVDVISQRLMVQGDEKFSSSSSSSTSSNASSSSSSSSRSGRPAKPGAPTSSTAAGPTTAAAAASPLQQQQQQQRLPTGQREYHNRSKSIAGTSSSGSCSSGRRPLQPSHPRSSSSRGSSRLGALRGLSSATAGLVPRNGLQMARLIVAEEGMRGLYRGFLPSIATFAPSSAVWWGSYGFWQKFIWLNCFPSLGSSSSTSSSAGGPTTGQVVQVQVVSAVLAGCTASLATNPLDVVKTRLQVADPRVSWRGVLTQLLSDQGVLGLWRGVAPRMISSAMWGTAMVSTYEFLKRSCVLPPEE